MAPLVRADNWKVLEILKSEGQSILAIDKNVEILSRIADRHYIIEKAAWCGPDPRPNCAPTKPSSTAIWAYKYYSAALVPSDAAVSGTS